MRIVKWLLISTLILVMPTIFADGVSQNFSPYMGSKNVSEHSTHVHVTHHKKYIPAYIAVLNSGSLKYNIVQIANRYGWNNVIWQTPDDYNWVGQTEVTANSLPELFNKILNNYPLQAQFYKGNHVLVIASRNLP